MRIGIDGNEANRKELVGVGRYAQEVIVHLYALQQKKKTDISFTIYLKDKPLPSLPKVQPWWKYEIIGPKPLWTQIVLPFALYTTKEKPNVFYTPSHYAPRFLPSPSVISIMDLSYVHFPEMFKKSDLYQLQDWTKYSVKKAKRILTISEHTKKDIVKEYSIDPQTIIVTYPGYDKTKFSPPAVGSELRIKEIKDKYKIENDYILYVGTLQPRKNIVRLIQAFAYLKDPKLQLVIVGKKGWLYDDILTKGNELGVSERIVFTDYVEEDKLPIFYQNATCFILPSLYEGFGLTVVEAMACGCPVIVSNTSSLPEIVGDAGIRINPNDVKNISSAIKRVLSNSEIRTTMIQQGFDQIKQFSWENCAEKTYNILREVGNSYV